MSAVIHKENSLAIVYDDKRLRAPAAHYFQPQYWRVVNGLDGSAPGRGNTWFVQAPFGRLVLRQYLRGGWAAKLSRSHYFFTAVERCRSFKEFQILSALQQAGLNVPQPIAALCEHHGLLSTGALLTEQIPDARTLADSMHRLDGGQWCRIGDCIHAFHIAGVWHADLNIRNILLDLQGQVFLIDFDRARYRPGKSVDGTQNLRRLRRSLKKHWPDGKHIALQAAWRNLMDGYHG